MLRVRHMHPLQSHARPNLGKAEAIFNHFQATLFTYPCYTKKRHIGIVLVMFYNTIPCS